MLFDGTCAARVLTIAEEICLNFKPTTEVPGLQYVGSVDSGSVAEKAGLKKGDFLLSVCTIL